MLSILPYAQIVLSVLLVAGILLQKRAAGLGGAFGGSDLSMYHTRRGAEKWFFYGTIVIAVLFCISSLLVIVL